LYHATIGSSKSAGLQGTIRTSIFYTVNLRNHFLSLIPVSFQNSVERWYRFSPAENGLAQVSTRLQPKKSNIFGVSYNHHFFTSTSTSLPHSLPYKKLQSCKYIKFKSPSTAAELTAIEGISSVAQLSVQLLLHQHPSSPPADPFPRLLLSYFVRRFRARSQHQYSDDLIATMLRGER
jgi:hypothetical protein